MRITSNKGFTLVEVIVVAILLSILALGAFSLYMMYSNETRVATANMKMQRQTEGLMDELTRRVREGTRVLAASGAACSTVTLGGNLDTIFCRTDSITIEGDTLYAFGFSSDTVKTRKFNSVGTTFNGGSFIVGDHILVNKDSSAFIVTGLYRLETDISLKTMSGKDTFNLRVNRGAFQCRN